MNEYGVVLFHTSSSAMQAEAVLVRAKFQVKLIPTPRELSSDCGISLRFDWNLNSDVQACLEKARVEIAGIHPLPWRK
jgi:hypothetical protein